MSDIAGTESYKGRLDSARGSARKGAWLVGGVFALLFALLFQYRILSLLKKLGWPVTPLGSRLPLEFDLQHASVWALPFLYTADYLNAVWSATLIGLFLGGAGSAFLPPLARRYLSGSGFRHQLAGALLGLPSMLCSCCAVGLLVTLPSVSLPSLWALGRAVNAKAAVCVGALIMALGVAGGLLVSLILESAADEHRAVPAPLRHARLAPLLRPGMADGCRRSGPSRSRHPQSVHRSLRSATCCPACTSLRPPRGAGASARSSHAISGLQATVR